MISGRLTRPDACWAAAVDFTRADSRSTSDSVSAEERRHDPQHQDPPLRRREEPAADLGADDQVHHQRVDAEADDRREVAGDQAGDELAEVDLPTPAGEWARNSPVPRSRSPTMVAAPTAVEIVSGTTTATGANRYTASA